VIAVDKRGRLGNQMFQYAFAVAVAQQLGTFQIYDTSELEPYFALLEPSLLKGARRRMARAYDRLFGFERREVDADDREDPDEVLANAANYTVYGGHFYSGHFFRPAAPSVRRAFTVHEVHIERFREKYASLLDSGLIDKVRRAAGELSQRLNHRPKSGPNAGSKYMKALGLK